MSKLYATNYGESIENFSFGSNVVNDELYTEVIYYIAANKPADLFEKPEEELTEYEQGRLSKYEDIDTLKELLDKHINGTEDLDDYDTLRIFARNVSPFTLMEFAMTEEQIEEAHDRVMNYFCYSDDDQYSYEGLDLLIEQKDDNYLVYLYAKNKIDQLLESSTKTNNSTKRNSRTSNK